MTRDSHWIQEVSGKTKDWKVYNNTKYGYQISYPDEWAGLRGGVEGGMFMMDAGSREEYRNHVWSVWTSPSEGLSLEEYLGKHLSEYAKKEGLDWSTNVVNKRYTTVNGVPAIEVAILSTPYDPKALGDINVVTVFLKGDTIFAIGMKAVLVEPKQTGIGYFSKYQYKVKKENLEVYDAMVSTFKFSR